MHQSQSAEISCQVLFSELFILTSSTNQYICNFIPATLIFKETACTTEVPCHIMEHAFSYLLIGLCILQLQPPYHTHFTSSSLWNLGHQVEPLEKKRDGTGSVPDQCCYNTCSKISQQKHSSWLLTSFQTVRPNTVMLKQNTFSLYGSSHCDKAVMEKLAENNTMGGKYTVSTSLIKKKSLIMFSIICCKVLWLMTQSTWMSLCHLSQFHPVTQNQFLVSSTDNRKYFYPPENHQNYSIH